MYFCTCLCMCRSETKHCLSHAKNEHNSISQNFLRTFLPFLCPIDSCGWTLLLGTMQPDIVFLHELVEAVRDICRTERQACHSFENMTSTALGNKDSLPLAACPLIVFAGRIHYESYCSFICGHVKCQREFPSESIGWTDKITMTPAVCNWGPKRARSFLGSFESL